MKKIIATCLFTLFLVSSLFAQSNTQTNFTIAPPPLGYPEFPEEGSVSNKIDFLYASVQGKDFSLHGMFLGWVPRYGNDLVAIEGLLGMSVMNGDITTPYGSQSLTFIGMHMAPAIELPIYNSKDFKFIMFGGYDFNLTRTSFTTTDPYSSGTMTWYLDTSLYGPLLGFQMHFGFADTFIFSPFFMMKSISGTVDVSTDPAYVSMQQSYDIPSYTVTTYGFDIIETESGVSLSGILDMAQKTEENSDVKTYKFSISMKI